MKALFEKIRYNYGNLLLFTSIAVFYLNCGCPIRFFTGVSCPGCGMTRALTALLRLDLSLAFEMHPLVFLLPIAAVVYFIRRLIPKKALRLIYVSALILLVAIYIIRMKAGSSVVYADFESGMLFKLFDKIIN